MVDPVLVVQAPHLRPRQLGPVVLLDLPRAADRPRRRRAVQPPLSGRGAAQQLRQNLKCTVCPSVKVNERERIGIFLVGHALSFHPVGYSLMTSMEFWTFLLLAFLRNLPC